MLPGRTHYSAIRELGEPNDPVYVIVQDFVGQLSDATRPQMGPK